MAKAKRVTIGQLEYILWKQIKGYEGLYEVSNTGLVKSLKREWLDKSGRMQRVRERILSFGFDKDGYVHVGLARNDKTTTTRVHQLVAKAFIPNPDNKPLPNHLNGIKHDNRVCNLEWATETENRIHSYRVLGQKSHFKKKIKQYSILGIFLKDWDSATDAARDLKIGREGIKDVLLGTQKTAYGFTWKYAS